MSVELCTHQVSTVSMKQIVFLRTNDCNEYVAAIRHYLQIARITDAEIDRNCSTTVIGHAKINPKY